MAAVVSAPGCTFTTRLVTHIARNYRGDARRQDQREKERKNKTERTERAKYAGLFLSVCERAWTQPVKGPARRDAAFHA